MPNPYLSSFRLAPPWLLPRGASLRLQIVSNRPSTRLFRGRLCGVPYHAYVSIGRASLSTDEIEDDEVQQHVAQHIVEERRFVGDVCKLRVVWIHLHA